MSDVTSFDTAQIDASVERNHQLIQKHIGEAVLSNSELSEVIKILNLKYAAYLKDRFFDVKLSADNRASLVTVLLRDPSGKFYYPVEAKGFHFNQETSSKGLALLALDYIDLYFQEFFESDELTFLPIDWTEYQCEGIDFLLKGQILNLQAEEEAAKLLGDEFEYKTPTNPTPKEVEGFKKFWKTQE